MTGKVLCICSDFLQYVWAKDTLTSWHHLFCASTRRVTTVASGHHLETPAVTTALHALAPCTSSRLQSSTCQPKATPELAFQLTRAKNLGVIHDFSVKPHSWTISKLFKHYFPNTSRISLFSPPPPPSHCLNHQHLSSILLQKAPKWPPSSFPWPLSLQAILSYNSNSLKHKPNHVTSLHKAHQWRPPTASVALHNPGSLLFWPPLQTLLAAIPQTHQVRSHLRGFAGAISWPDTKYLNDWLL